MTGEDSWTALFPFHTEKLQISAEISEDASTGILHLTGQLTTENSSSVSAHLNRIINSTHTPPTVVLNLRGLRYASSTGIGVIAGLLVDLQNRSIALQLANVGESVREVFDLLGFSAFFEFVEWP
ncbi:MAG: STAS domain-containing protein [Alkalispirochaeta sp.]